MVKNAAQRVVFPILDADGDPVSGAADLDSERSLDGGAFADCSNEATEIGSSGIYYLDLAVGETNGDVVCIQVKTSTSGAKTTVLVFYTSAQSLNTIDAIVDAIKAKLDDGTTGLANLKALIDDIETKLDNPANFMADVSALALEATLTAIKGAGWTNETLKLIKELVDELEKPLPKAHFKI